MSDNNENDQKERKKSKYDLNLKYGIERISVNENIKHLPNKANIEPVDGKIEDKLKAVLDIKTLTGSMIASLRPKITNRNILSPQQFKLKLQQVIDVMQKECVLNKFCNKELFNDTIKLLESEQRKSESLDEYRHTLLLG